MNQYYAIEKKSNLLKHVADSLLLLKQTIEKSKEQEADFYILQDVSPSRYGAWGTWVVYLVFMGAVPWVLVPYTDAAGVIIPVTIFALYLKQKKVLI